MKYSIITCFYNAEVYIDEYFACIQNIDYEDYEVILVNDCSTDMSEPGILSRIENSDKFVYKKHNKNLGPGIARNTGLKYASGQFIIFLDIDDKVHKDIFKTLDEYDNYDIVLYDYFSFTKEDQEQGKSIIANPQIEVTSINNLMKRTTGCVWGKRYKKEIINSNQIVFPDLSTAEDLVFIIRYLHECKSYKYIQKALYYYRISDSSLMHRNIELQIKSARKAMSYLEPLLNNEEDVYKILYLKEIIYDSTNIYIRLGKNKKELRNFWESEKIDWSLMQQKDVFNKVQRIILFLIKHKNYEAIKLINKMR